VAFGEPAPARLARPGECLTKACEVTLDGDVAFSPLTNFTPARRLAGAPADHVMAWVSGPDLAVPRSEQRYVGLEGGFTAELELDGRVASAARA
jgi:hypothetical protein